MKRHLVNGLSGKLTGALQMLLVVGIAGRVAGLISPDFVFGLLHRVAGGLSLGVSGKPESCCSA